MAMRALRWPDAFPKEDIAVRNSLGGVTAKEAEVLSQPWRPWRSYAVMHLWSMAAPSSRSRGSAKESVLSNDVASPASVSSVKPPRRMRPVPAGWSRQTSERICPGRDRSVQLRRAPGLRGRKRVRHRRARAVGEQPQCHPHRHRRQQRAVGEALRQPTCSVRVSVPFSAVTVNGLNAVCRTPLTGAVTDPVSTSLVGGVVGVVVVGVVEEPLQAASDAVTNITATSGNKCVRISLLCEAKALRPSKRHAGRKRNTSTECCGNRARRTRMTIAVVLAAVQRCLRWSADAPENQDFKKISTGMTYVVC